MSESVFAETADIETASDDYAGRFTGAVGDYFLQRQARITLDLLEGYEGASVLDVGGGHCQLAAPLIAKGFNVTLTGSDDTCRQRPDRLLPQGTFTYHTCDCLNLPFADNAFDVAISFRLLPHVQAWQRLIAELCRVAGKAVILDYPDVRSSNILYQLLFQLKKSMEGNTRTYFIFRRAQLREQFVINGFSSPEFRPEFFWPMVVHRALKRPALSKALEWVPAKTALTVLFGSPVILKSVKRQPGHPGKA